MDIWLFWYRQWIIIDFLLKILYNIYVIKNKKGDIKDLILIKIRKNLISDLIKDFCKTSSLDSKSFKYLKDFYEEKASFYCNLALSHYH